MGDNRRHQALRFLTTLEADQNFWEDIARQRDAKIRELEGRLSSEVDRSSSYRDEILEEGRRADKAESALQRVKEDGLVRCFNTHIANACGHDALRKCRACLWNEENGDG